MQEVVFVLDHIEMSNIEYSQVKIGHKCRAQAKPEKPNYQS